MGILQNVAIGGGAIAAIIAAVIIFSAPIGRAFNQFGAGVGGALSSAGTGFLGAFEGLEFPSFDFGGNGDESGASELAGETVPFGMEGGTVTIPEDTTVNPDGTVTSSTPPIATDPDLTAIQAFTQQRKGIFEDVAQIFDINAIQSSIDVALEQPNVTDLPAAEDFRQATEELLRQLENPNIVGDEPIGFFDVFEDVAPLPLSQFAIDFFRDLGRDPELAFDIPSFEAFGGA